jgi:hypothetical protein
LTGPFRRQPADDQCCEQTSRFIDQDGHFTASKLRVKPRAYQPARRDNQVSVICADGLNDNASWRTGDLHVAPLRARPVLARADLNAKHIRSTGLSVVRDDVFPRHANITGWPSAKHEWKSLAQELAAAARLVVKPEVGTS